MQQGKQTDAYHLCFISLFIVLHVFLNMLINESFTANLFFLNYDNRGRQELIEMPINYNTIQYKKFIS